jgi:hypothetical protein
LYNSRRFDFFEIFGLVMWKIVIGFIVFAALGLFLISRGGDNIDLGGEKHDTGSTAPAPAPAPTPAPTPAAK